MYIAL
jgi:hypothetical protein